MKIFINNLIYKGIHGLTDKESSSPQRFRVDVTVDCFESPGTKDDINETLDYRIVKNVVREVIEGPHRDLLETMGETIADRIMENVRVRSATIRVQKPDIWDNGIPGIEISRMRS
jgi:dihydroneopterin aldolase